jgi:hypothetical protein
VELVLVCCGLPAALHREELRMNAVQTNFWRVFTRFVDDYGNEYEMNYSSPWALQRLWFYAPGYFWRT